MARKPEHNVICIRCRESIASIAHVACMDAAELEARTRTVARRLAHLTGTEDAGGPVAGYAREDDDDDRDR